jgi:hypothetical protein
MKHQDVCNECDSNMMHNWIDPGCCTDCREDLLEIKGLIQMYLTTLLQKVDEAL